MLAQNIVLLILAALSVSSAFMMTRPPAFMRSSRIAMADEVKEWVGAKKFAAKDKEVKTILSNEQIAKILPHRYPFLLVDRVVEFEAGKRAVGIKAVTANEPQFTGHFPDRPIMPGVLMIEAMAQLGNKPFPQQNITCNTYTFLSLLLYFRRYCLSFSTN